MHSIIFLALIAALGLAFAAYLRSQHSRSGANASTHQDSSTPVFETEVGGQILGLYPANETSARAESALPGTSSIPDQLTLTPPTNGPDAAEATEVVEQDIEPVPFAEFGVDVTLTDPTDAAHIGAQFTSEVRDAIGGPAVLVHDPDGGRWTHLVLAETPHRVDALRLAYSLADWAWDDATSAERIAAIRSGVELLPEILDRAGIGHTVVPPDWGLLPEWLEIGQSIAHLRRDFITIALDAPAYDPFDGKAVWTTLHAAGLPWGDMDHFHWPDPTGQSDYLFDVWVEDGQVGYALPELIARDEQDFLRLSFAFDIARSPDPHHVHREMQRAVEFVQARLGGIVVYVLGDQVVAGPEEQEAGIRQVEETLAGFGLRPGDPAVLMLH